MPKEIICTPEAPQSPMYSQAVKAGHTIYVAGTTGVDVTTGEFAGATVKEQARQSLLNCQAVLRAAGAALSDAVMVHTLLMRPETPTTWPRSSTNSSRTFGRRAA